MPVRLAFSPALTIVTRTVTVAAGPFAPGHLGELTALVPFELVDAVLTEAWTVQRRLRDLPSRVGMYFLLAMCLFPEVGYRLVWDKLTGGLTGRWSRRVRSPCETCAADSAVRRYGPCSRSSPVSWPARRRRGCGSVRTRRCRSTAAARCGYPIHRATGPGWGGRLITAIPQWS